MFLPFKIAKFVVKLLVVIAVGFVAVTAGRVVYAAQQDDAGPADVILVLGASQINGKPSPLLQARLDHAQDLYLAKAAPRIVTLGGKRVAAEVSEAQAGRDYLVRSGVRPADVVASPVGSDTRRELVAAQAVMRKSGWRTAILVTDPWHALRVRSMAKASGISGSTSPTHDGPASASFTQEARYVARETVAYAAWSLFGKRFDGPGRQL